MCCYEIRKVDAEGPKLELFTTNANSNEEEERKENAREEGIELVMTRGIREDVKNFIGAGQGADDKANLLLKTTSMRRQM